MANVRYWSGSWVSTGEDDLQPGDAHSWIAWPIEYGEALSLSASPVQGGVEHILAVQDVSIQSDPGGRRIFFTVKERRGNRGPGLRHRLRLYFIGDSDDDHLCSTR
jgi:hypothetical protein